MGGLISFFTLNIAECALCAGCSCLSSILNSTLSQSARFGHTLIAISTFALAFVIGRFYPNYLTSYTYMTKLNLTEDCSSLHLDECIYRQLIYRSGFALVIFFLIMIILSYMSDYFNRSLWIVKFILVFGMCGAFLWIPNSFFVYWAEISRLMSFIWLLVQGLLFLDIAHDSHDIIISIADDRERDYGSAYYVYVFYLMMSLLFGSLSITGIAFLFTDYSSCQLGLSFTIVTLILGIILTILSILNIINRGLLTPCMMFAYSVFMCWYALLSCPDKSCNPSAAENWSNEKITALGIVTTITIMVLVYCIVFGTVILNIFNPEVHAI